MKKLICLLLFLCLLLTGCHGSKDSSAFEIPDAFDENRIHEITFWAKNDTNILQTQIYEKAIADFQSLYPNIKVNLRLYTDYGKIYNDVITNIQTGTTPNVCITYPDHIATYLTADNCVVPLDVLFDDPRYGLSGSEVIFDGPGRDEIIPQFLAECAFSGSHYAMPFMRSTEACYINVDFVKKLGYEVPEILTWDYIFEVADAAAATKGEDGIFGLNGQKVLIPFIYKSTDNMMIQMLRQKDAGYSTPEGEIGIFNDTTKEILLSLVPHVKNGAFSTFKISSYPANFLNAGQCIFAIDSTAGATWMGTNAPLLDIAEEALVEFETAVRPVPQFDPENPKMISQGPSICVFNKEDPQEVLASWLFAQYLLTNEVQIAYSGTEGYVPVTSKAQESAEYQDYLARCGEDNQHYYDVKIKAAELLRSNTDNTFVTPVFNGSASLRNAAGQMIEEVTKGTRRKKDVNDDFISGLYADMISLYRLDQIEAGTTGKMELGPMPAPAKALIGTLIGAWVLIALYAIKEAVKKKKYSRH